MDLKKIKIVSDDSIDIKKDYIISYTKSKDEHTFILDSRKVEINEFIKLITSKIAIKDIDIESNNIDDLVLKLYEEFGI